ncbi:MAG: hypothetical protein A2X03_09170 [Bacteroidetes bacterium GWA2_40_15]|nr:MAG: hypothetical protein A2X03_09170 [Bacteroidetes bacterium GWA2_40_15]
MFWHFPATFTSGNSKGIRPRSAYLKVIGDFTLWNGRLVFGCDDSAQKEFQSGQNAVSGSIMMETGVLHSLLKRTLMVMETGRK